MTPLESISLPAMLALAAGAGIVHTLVGPDHYVPLIAAGRAERWSARRVAVVTAILGSAHCLMSVVLVAGLALFVASAVPSFVEGMGQVAALVLVAAGAVYAVRAWRRRRAIPSGADRGDDRARTGLPLIAVALLVGPCEWMIPFALAANEGHGFVGMMTVAAVYSTCTVAMMIAATLVGTLGLRRFDFAHRADVVAASACIVCGALMLAGA